MKRIAWILLGLIIITVGCQGKETSAPVEAKSSAPETALEERVKELEKQVEKKVEKASEKSWGDAPDFTLPLVGGGELTLSDYAGKVIIIDFWATWCGPCKMGIPEFVELYKEYKDKGVVILGINLDTGPRQGVDDFVKGMKINYPVVYGNTKITRDFGGVRGIPAAFVIDRDGNVVNKLVGYRPRSTFESEIKKYL